MVRPTLYEIDTANRTLPLVRSIVRDLVEEFHALRLLGREQRSLEAARLTNGAAPVRIETLRTEVERSTGRIEGYLRELEGLGIEMRDLETGLVDFPTLMNGEPAYFCWKPGEAEVLWWHAASQGVADRRPVTRVVSTLS